MPFFNGVSTDASAYPLNATDIANQINLLFANPNGMVSILAVIDITPCQFLMLPIMECCMHVVRVHPSVTDFDVQDEV